MSQENEKVTILVASCIYITGSRNKKREHFRQQNPTEIHGWKHSLDIQKNYLFMLIYIYMVIILVFYGNPCSVSY